MTTSDKIAVRRLDAQGVWGAFFDEIINRCDSPIEQLFFGHAFSRAHILPMPVLPFQHALVDAAGIRQFRLSFLTVPSAGIVLVQPELVVKGREIRLDCAILLADRRIAIELDGQDFHERTKEQATRDKQRDRDLQAAGWRVLRFAGSEVYANAGACWAAVEEHLQS